MNSILRSYFSCPVLVLLSLLSLSGVSSRLSAQSEGDALDAPGLPWVVSGSSLWFAQTDVTHDGVDALQSGFIFSDQESIVSATVTGPGVIAFNWKVSSEEAFDFVEFATGPNLFPPTVVAQIAGEVNWERRFFSIPAGVRIIQWRFFNDAFVTMGQNAAWLDEVVFAPNSGPPVIVAEPQSYSVVTGVSLTLTVGAAGVGPLTYQWQRNETPVPGATASTLPLNNIQLGQAGQYRVVVGNSLGAVTSSV